MASVKSFVAVSNMEIRTRSYINTNGEHRLDVEYPQQHAMQEAVSGLYAEHMRVNGERLENATQVEHHVTMVKKHPVSDVRGMFLVVETTFKE